MAGGSIAEGGLLVRAASVFAGEEHAFPTRKEGRLQGSWLVVDDHIVGVHKGQDRIARPLSGKTPERTQLVHQAMAVETLLGANHVECTPAVPAGRVLQHAQVVMLLIRGVGHQFHCHSTSSEQEQWQAVVVCHPFSYTSRL